MKAQSTEIGSLFVNAIRNVDFLLRVDWVGELAFPNIFARRTQPSALLFFSSISNDSLDYIDSPSFPSSKQQNQHKYWVSIGSLGLFKVGDVWHKGRLEHKPSYQLETFNNLLINPRTSTLVKAGLNLNDEGFLLPLDEHPWHRQNTQSYCVLVDLPDNRRLIVPCYEIIRFYFGSSSNLLSKLFTPTLTRGKLFSDPKFDYLSKHLQITLASKISGYSAADIGRLACDPVAWKAAAMIGASCLKAKINGEPIYPQTLFPFEGETTLTASGKWLSFGGRPNATFLVYSLRSCSHPFPFKSLRYETAQSQPFRTRPENGFTKQYGSTPDPTEQTLVEHDASRSLTPKTKRIRENIRFPDLQGKPVWKSKPFNNQSPEDVIRRPVETPVTEIAVGDPGSNERIRPVDLVTVFNQVSKRVIPFFLGPLVEHLKTMTTAQIHLLTSSEHDGWTIPTPLVGDEDGVIDLWRFQFDDNGHKRTKRIAIFEVNHHQNRLFVAAIEGLFDDGPPLFAILFDDGKSLSHEEATRKIVKALIHLENVRPGKNNPDCEVAWFFEKLVQRLDSI